MKVLLQFKLKGQSEPFIRFTKYEKVLSRFGSDLEWIEPIRKDRKCGQ